jgi:hypothetical protein
MNGEQTGVGGVQARQYLVLLIVSGGVLCHNQRHLFEFPVASPSLPESFGWKTARRNLFLL